MVLYRDNNFYSHRSASYGKILYSIIGNKLIFVKKVIIPINFTHAFCIEYSYLFYIEGYDDYDYQ